MDKSIDNFQFTLSQIAEQLGIGESMADFDCLIST